MSDPLAAIQSEFQLTIEIFRELISGFKKEYDRGLVTKSVDGLASMLPSYIKRLPTGGEIGTFLSLDFGGTNLRVSAVQLLGHGKVDLITVRKTIPGNFRTGTVVEFFDWAVDAVQELVDRASNSHIRLLTDDPLMMGVCWSFPLDQCGVASGKILRMGKGFTLENIEGNDVIQLFHEAFTRKGLHVRVVALVNDAVGTLVAHAYSHPSTSIGFVYGTGINASYPELTSRIRKLSQSDNQDGMMLINTEVGVLGDCTFLPLTRFDKMLDSAHSQPGYQLFEKMMSGAYLGELTRRVALDLILQNYLFDGNMPVQLQQDWSFSTEMMGMFEGLRQESWPSYLSWWTFLGSSYSATLQDMLVFTKVCHIVSSRAAGLAAAAIASIIEQQQLQESTADIVVGINGSTYEKYPNMADRVKTYLVDWFGQDVANRIHLQVAADGGSIGGALVAMLYQESNCDQPQSKLYQNTLHRDVSSKVAQDTSYSRKHKDHAISRLLSYIGAIRQWIEAYMWGQQASYKSVKVE